MPRTSPTDEEKAKIREVYGDDLGPPTIADLCFGAILLGATVLLAVSLASLVWPPLE